MLKMSIACQSSTFVSKILNDIPMLIGHIIIKYISDSILF